MEQGTTILFETSGLLSFIYGEGKMAIYISRINKIGGKKIVKHPQCGAAKSSSG